MIESLITPKEKVKHIDESLSCAEAIQYLESHGLRCVPVLDATRTIFRGNIFRYHIYQHKFRYPEADLSRIPVTRFLKNTTKVVRVTDSILKLIFVMKDLPHIAVLNEKNSFVGIIEHSTMIDFLSEAWLSKHSKYLLEVSSVRPDDHLLKLTKLITKYTNIISAMNFEETSYSNQNISLFILPDTMDILELNDLERLLRKKGYKSTHYKIK